MLKIDDLRTLHGMQVNGDDKSDHTFYILPEHPTFARMPNGGAARCASSSTASCARTAARSSAASSPSTPSFPCPTETDTKITAELQEEVDGAISSGASSLARREDRAAGHHHRRDGAVKLLLKQGGNLVEKIRDRGQALAGRVRNIASFSMELTELGTAIFKETLSTGRASAVQVVYDLNFHGRLPEMHAWGTWNASEFYCFVQSVQVRPGQLLERGQLRLRW